jgi:hypothetical protein
METIDFAIGWPIKETDPELFLEALESEVKARHLTFRLIQEKELAGITKLVKQGLLKIRFYLDMASDSFSIDNPFTRFNYILKDSGALVVDDPDDIRLAADKSVTHYKLMNAGIPVPFTVVIRNWEPGRHLTDGEKIGLGVPFVVKPAQGFGQKGVQIIRTKPKLKDIADARKFNVGDNFLLQQFIEPLMINNMPAWFRVYNLFGEIIPCWWNPFNNEYLPVTLKQMHENGLLPLARITSEIGQVTGIAFFSCEIAINRHSRDFVVIDYLNDQCAMYPKTKHADGVPDDIITNIASRFAEKAREHANGLPTLSYRAIWFPKIKPKEEDA